MRRKNLAPRAQWAERIERLRSQLGLSQSEFGRRLGVSPMAVSRWENGENEPAADICIQIGRLAGGKEGWYFLELAGLNRADLEMGLPQAQRVAERLRRARRKVEISPGHGDVWEGIAQRRMLGVVVLPLVKTPEAALSPNMLDEDDVVDVVLASRRKCKHPAETVCLENSTDAMAPTIRQGYTVALDTAEKDLRHLNGKIVAGIDRGQFVMGRLRQSGDTWLLVPENRDREVLTVVDGPAFRLLGRVIWWQGEE